jgi:hypothetical protein
MRLLCGVYPEQESEIASPEPAPSDKVRLLRGVYPEQESEIASPSARNDRILSRTLILTCSIAFFFLSACTQMEKAKDTALVKDMIMSYNKLLIEAAKTGDTEPLKDLLIQREREKLNHWIASWHDSNVYMDGRLENIKFKNITISGNAANVITSEDWVYEYKNLKTRQSVLPASAIYYEMEYILQKKENKWIIAQINIKAEKSEKITK